jgi:hypothetical protein
MVNLKLARKRQREKNSVRIGYVLLPLLVALVLWSFFQPPSAYLNRVHSRSLAPIMN